MKIVIDDDTPMESNVTLAGCTGLVPRPEGQQVRALPFDMPTIPRDEWPERIKDMEASKSRLSDIIRKAGIKSKDQNDPKYMNTRNPRWGYCWCYGTVGAMEALRAVMNLPHVPLSAFFAAWTMQGHQDKGGWGAQSLEFAMDRGIPSEAVCPNFKDDPSLDNAATWADAAKYKVAEAWVDLTSPVYNRDMTLDQKMTCLFNRVPVVNDYPWWSHCVYSCDVVDVDKARDAKDPLRYGSRDRNSWGDSYGDQGFFLVTGTRCTPGNAVAPTLINPVWSRT